MHPPRGPRRAARTSQSGAVATVERRPIRVAPLRIRNDRSQAGALAFLGDVLSGDSNWSVDEVTKLLALHTLVAVGRRRVVGLDDLPAAAD
jgi:hypothetical protein